MNTRSSCILGGCIIIAAAITAIAPRPLRCCRVSTQAGKENTNRFQVSNPGEKGNAFVIDTISGQVWRIPVGMSGATDSDRFFNKKL